jgi:nicotinate-nucleotide adenylyltransferase
VYHPLRQRIVTAPMIQISASDIRRRVRAGQSIDFLTPPAVVEYIVERGLYRS